MFVYIAVAIGAILGYCWRCWQRRSNWGHFPFCLLSVSFLLFSSFFEILSLIFFGEFFLCLFVGRRRLWHLGKPLQASC